MNLEAIFTLLFVVVTAVAIAARRLPIPYTVALVVAGLGLSRLHVLAPPALTKELLFSVFLPGLLFEAAFHIEFGEFRRDGALIAALAVPGVLVSTALTALILTPVADALHFVERFTWRHALVFAVLISATDPVAVVAIFRSLRVPRRLIVLLEGESLLNDGTAVVLFGLSLALASGGEVTTAQLAREFLRVVGLGALIGGAVGLAVSELIRRVDDAMIEITLTTIAAYGSFTSAEQFQASGVIATVVAGLLCGNYAARTGMSPSTRIATETFWEYVAFALNSIVFLLIGFEVRPAALLDAWRPIAVAYLAVTLGRALVIGGGTWLVARGANRIPASWSAPLTWGGLRGALPMVLVLSLAPSFPQRTFLVSITFGVVVVSILLQGLTMSPLLLGLEIGKRSRERENYALMSGRLQAANAALRELERMAHMRAAHPAVVGALREEYEQTIAAAEQGIGELHVERSELREEELRWARRHLLLVEKGEVIELLHQGRIERAAHDRLIADVDARLLRLESGADAKGEQGAGS